MFVEGVTMNKSIKILILNIGNPSIERAKKQVEWLQNREEDLFFLTETKNSKGCNYIANHFSSNQNTMSFADFKTHVSFPKSITGDYGVMCISKHQIKASHSPFAPNDQYYCRYLENDIIINQNKLKTVCLYVPSRDRSNEKIIHKRNFLEKSLINIGKNDNVPTIICGDFNILERNHIPHYSVFKEWEYDFYDKLIDTGFIDVYKYCYPEKHEYSWVGRTGDGYRYDYCFISYFLSNRIIDCKFIHETRHDKLTDHSALMVEIDFAI